MEGGMAGGREGWRDGGREGGMERTPVQKHTRAWSDSAAAGGVAVAVAEVVLAPPVAADTPCIRQGQGHVCIALAGLQPEHGACGCWFCVGLCEARQRGRACLLVLVQAGGVGAGAACVMGEGQAPHSSALTSAPDWPTCSVACTIPSAPMGVLLLLANICGWVCLQYRFTLTRLPPESSCTYPEVLVTASSKSAFV